MAVTIAGCDGSVVATLGGTGTGAYTRRARFDNPPTTMTSSSSKSILTPRCWRIDRLTWLSTFRFSLPELAMGASAPDTGDGGPDSVDAAAAPSVGHPRLVLQVDHSERHAALLDLARACIAFDVRMERLAVGDYLIGSGILVERKTYADFALSLADGRLFPQAAALARSRHRPVLLLEGPKPDRMPDVHPHALKGAIASLAVMWRLPVLHARDPNESLRILRFLAQQLAASTSGVLKRYDRKPKRDASRKLYVLQGLPGVGPALARRLLVEFGSVERVVIAGEQVLTRVRGLGPKKAARIRAVLS